MRDFFIVLSANLIESGKSLAEIHDMLLKKGATEETAYLCFQAGRLLLQERIDSAKRVNHRLGENKYEMPCLFNSNVE